jgi:outer membrane protein
LLPQISILGDLDRSNVPKMSVENALTRTASIIANATMPVYEGGAIYSQTRQAEQTVARRRSEVDDARRAAVQTTAQTWASLQAARASIGSFEAAVRTAQIALAGMQEELLDGRRTVLDVLVGQQQVFSTQSPSTMPRSPSSTSPLRSAG